MRLHQTKVALCLLALACCAPSAFSFTNGQKVTVSGLTDGSTEKYDHSFVMRYWSHANGTYTWNGMSWIRDGGGIDLYHASNPRALEIAYSSSPTKRWVIDYFGASVSGSSVNPSCVDAGAWNLAIDGQHGTFWDSQVANIRVVGDCGYGSPPPINCATQSPPNVFPGYWSGGGTNECLWNSHIFNPDEAAMPTHKLGDWGEWVFYGPSQDSIDSDFGPDYWTRGGVTEPVKQDGLEVMRWSWFGVAYPESSWPAAPWPYGATNPAAPNAPTNPPSASTNEPPAPPPFVPPTNAVPGAGYAASTNGWQEWHFQTIENYLSVIASQGKSASNSINVTVNPTITNNLALSLTNQVDLSGVSNIFATSAASGDYTSGIPAFAGAGTSEVAEVGGLSSNILDKLQSAYADMMGSNAWFSLSPERIFGSSIGRAQLLGVEVSPGGVLGADTVKLGLVVADHAALINFVRAMFLLLVVVWFWYSTAKCFFKFAGL